MNKNVINNHQLITNSDQYYYEKKYLSVHSEDRDYNCYPNSSEFEILLPQDYLNVASMRLANWSFPSNYSVFSVCNINMAFKFLKIYNPSEHGVTNLLLEGIFDALSASINDNYVITIENGFYNPIQMVTELTNKFNQSVSEKIHKFFQDNSVKYSEAKKNFKSYDRFKVVYNSVSMKIWFGNTADQFTLNNEYTTILTNALGQENCVKRKTLPEYDNWGLPAYLGFSKTNYSSYNVTQYDSLNANTRFSDIRISTDLTLMVPRFYYGDAVPGSGDNGYWLLPEAPGSTVYFLEAPHKICFMGPDHIYMEIDGMNSIDETSPWNISEYTIHNNQTNGRVLSSFAKIPLSSTPISQFYDRDSITYKYWNPPAERITKLKFKFRYHNGQLVDFGHFNFTFMIEFNILRPQQERAYSIRNAFDLKQIQTFR